MKIKSSIDALTSDIHLFMNKDELLKKCFEMFKKIDKTIKKKNVSECLSDIIKNYYDVNNYHNFTHAFEVFQMSFVLIQSEPIKHTLTKNEKLCLLITCLCHDINHIGISNKSFKDTSFNIKKHIEDMSVNSRKSLDLNIYENVLLNHEVKDDIMGISSNSSYNECVHISQTNLIMGIHLDKLVKFKSLNERHQFLKTINCLILSTDVTLHKHFFNVIKERNIDDSLALMTLLIKFSDISHPSRHFTVHAHWVYNLINENNNINYCSKSIDLAYVAEDTINFVKIYVNPLLNELCRNYKSDVTDVLEKNINTNINIWNNYVS